MSRQRIIKNKMESRIKVNFDHLQKEPYVQVYLEDLKPEDNDLRDEMLHLFIGHANTNPVVMLYSNEAKDNRTPQFRIITLDSPTQSKTNLLTVFAGFTNSIIGNLSTPDNFKERNKIVESFFDLMYNCIDPTCSFIKPSFQKAFEHLGESPYV